MPSPLHADIDTLDTMFTSGVATLVANLFRLLTIRAAMSILTHAVAGGGSDRYPHTSSHVTSRCAYATQSAPAQSRRRNEYPPAGNTCVVSRSSRLSREANFVARFARSCAELQASNRSTIYSSFYPPMTALMT
jgi:hypothetical protein